MDTELAATLGSIDDPFNPSIRVDHRPLVDAKGHYLVIGNGMRSILEYDTSGRFVGDIGSFGKGPGEFREIAEILLRDDSIIAVDPANRRLSVLTPGGDYVRSLPLDFRPIRSASLGAGRLLLSGTAHGMATIGRPLQIVDLNADTATPFGPEVVVIPKRPSMALRVVAGRGSTIWASRPDRYELQEWTLDGTRGRRIDRQVAWFPDREVEGAVQTKDEVPYPWVQDLHVDSEGRIWTMVRIPDPDFRPSGESYSYLDQDEVFDTVVEVLDAAGRVLAVRRFSWYGHGFASDGSLVSQRRGPLDLLLVDVWRVTLTTPDREYDHEHHE